MKIIITDNDDTVLQEYNTADDIDRDFFIWPLVIAMEKESLMSADKTIAMLRKEMMEQEGRGE